MNKPLISVLIVNFNTVDFIELSLFALKKLTKNPYRVFIADNGSEISDFLKLQKIVATSPEVSLKRFETDLRGSLAHGTALNALTEKVNTPFFSILDADATWLIKDWDEILINRLKGQTKVIGTQAPPGKPQDFPLMFASLFETETFRTLHIDFRPKDIAQKQDTGFEMREKYLAAGFRGENIDFFNTRNFHIGSFPNVTCAEYYLSGEPHIFASHFGRGSTLGEAKYRKGWKKYFYSLPLLGNNLLKAHGSKEKTEWISICRKLIQDQI
ncbi:MAG TPA: glycosyltransferase family 2 protein [Candidatus Paceibacterota bacterium]|nr:glycosyltransferase family 2 protein [Candidatus Paceibacterota bacterium]